MFGQPSPARWPPGPCIGISPCPGPPPEPVLQVLPPPGTHPGSARQVCSFCDRSLAPLLPSKRQNKTPTRRSPLNGVWILSSLTPSVCFERGEKGAFSNQKPHESPSVTVPPLTPVSTGLGLSPGQLQRVRATSATWGAVLGAHQRCDPPCLVL